MLRSIRTRPCSRNRIMRALNCSILSSTIACVGAANSAEFVVHDFPTLTEAIHSANALDSRTTPHVIRITDDIHVRNPLPPIFCNLSIEGGGHTLLVDGDILHRLFFVGVDAPTSQWIAERYPDSPLSGRIRVELTNMTLTGGIAAGGGTTSLGAGAGGGGMGAGGALFINGNADVTATKVHLLGNIAMGGRGGTGASSGGGGSGMGGDTFSGGGGLYPGVFLTYAQAGGAGIFSAGGAFGGEAGGGGGYYGKGGANAANGLDGRELFGFSGSGAAGGTNPNTGGAPGSGGANGGGGGSSSSSAGGGGCTGGGGGGGYGGTAGGDRSGPDTNCGVPGGGVGGYGGDGGFGGGGGRAGGFGHPAGRGGFGGGGGGNVGGGPIGNTVGGDGGFGGGGGYGAGFLGIPGNGGFGGGGGSCGGGNESAIQCTGGAGGFGAGGGHGATGGAGGYAAGDGSPRGTNTGDVGGGAGAGLGGAIFIVDGGTLVISDVGAISGNNVLGGVGGAASAGNGQAFGSGLFLQGSSGSITFDLAGSTRFVVDDGIADQSGNPGAQHFVAGVRGINKTGTGTLVLNGQNRFTATSSIDDGTLELNGTVMAPLQVAESASMSGTGTANSVDVRGVLSAGNASTPNGTLTTTGVLLFASSAELLTTCNEQEICSKVSAQSNVNLDGTARLLLARVPVLGSQLLLVESQGGLIAGTFARAVTNLGVRGSIIYSPTQARFVVTDIDPIFSDDFDPRQ